MFHAVNFVMLYCYENAYEFYTRTAVTALAVWNLLAFKVRATVPELRSWIPS